MSLYVNVFEHIYVFKASLYVPNEKFLQRSLIPKTFIKKRYYFQNYFKKKRYGNFYVSFSSKNVNRKLTRLVVHKGILTSRRRWTESLSYISHSFSLRPFSYSAVQYSTVLYRVGFSVYTWTYVEASSFSNLYAMRDVCAVESWLCDWREYTRSGGNWRSGRWREKPISLDDYLVS